MPSGLYLPVPFLRTKCQRCQRKFGQAKNRIKKTILREINNCDPFAEIAIQNATQIEAVNNGRATLGFKIFTLPEYNKASNRFRERKTHKDYIINCLLFSQFWPIYTVYVKRHDWYHVERRIF